MIWLFASEILNQFRSGSLKKNSPNLETKIKGPSKYFHIKAIFDRKKVGKVSGAHQ